ncbi:MAG: RDD family protein [Phototrophicaceae bacterium]
MNTSQPVVGIGSRMVAALVDLSLTSVSFVLVASAVTPLETLLNQQVVILWAMLIATHLVYCAVLEWWWNGQTLGKRLVGLRVICADGQPLQVSHIVVRTATRLVDILPFPYGIGFISMMIDPQHRRFGDRLSGTVVTQAMPSVVSSQQVSAVEYVHIRRVSPIPSYVEVGGLTSATQQSLKEFLGIRPTLHTETREWMAHHLATQALREMGTAEVFGELRGWVQAETLLEQIIRRLEVEERLESLQEQTE